MKMIPLTQGKYTLVDDEDFEYLNQWKWYAQKWGRKYCAMRAASVRVKRLMHRVIMNAPDGLVVDHIDGDSLNNTRGNLRICTHQENTFNRDKPLKANTTSRYLGVEKHRRKWRTTLVRNGIKVFRKSFDTEEEAARAFDEATKQYSGEYAKLNF